MTMLGPKLKPWERYQTTTDSRASMPDIIEFVQSDHYLNRPQLFPRQATLLKTIFLQAELYTPYDEDVLAEWISSFERGEEQGVSPDIVQRIAICRAEGRPWFREVMMILGRRGSKGHIGALAGAYILWYYLSLGNPQDFYGIDRSKQIAAFVFAGKKDQAKANQWMDIYHVVTEANCFAPFISRALSEYLSIYSPYDMARMEERQGKDIETTIDEATFLILPKESSPSAARGPASFMQFYDEMAFIIPTGPVCSAEMLYFSAKPSLDQFHKDAFLYEQSSPWEMTGQFYTNSMHAIEQTPSIDGSLSQPKYPSMMALQLPSWGLYQDWERAEDLGFQRLDGAVSEFDEEMRSEQQRNPERFGVERLAHWATVQDAYLNPNKIAAMWAPWPTHDRVLLQQSQGILNVNYRAHGDPSSVNAGFGWSICHLEGPDEKGMMHVVFDVIHVWEPQDYPDHTIDYEMVDNDIMAYMDAFMPSEVSFDQYSSVSTIQKLNRHVSTSNYPKRVTVYERPATATLNWKTYETLKVALNMGLVHSCWHEKADLELRYLKETAHKVDKPSTGPVQTKDIADCIAINVYSLLSEALSPYMNADLTRAPRGALAGGISPYPQTDANGNPSPFTAFQRGQTGFKRGSRTVPGRGRPSGPRR